MKIYNVVLFFACSLFSVFEFAHAQDRQGVLLTTITNPTPAFSDIFGASVAGFGNDRFLAGTDGGGAAYLYRTSGQLLKTFTIADPNAAGFGNPVVGVGLDGVLISAYSYGLTSQVGRAYLFGTNGSLRTTFTNPSPAKVQAFGLSVSAMDEDRVLIGGVPEPNKPAPYTGGVYLFKTNGTLLASFFNPTPSVSGSFGLSVASLGTDRVVIGAPGAGVQQSGAAYIFNTNGLLLTTITNPVPKEGDYFGSSAARVGNDRFVVGVGNGGAAYLFNLSGALLTTLTNPVSEFAQFGVSVSAVGTNRLLIGACYAGLEFLHSGAAYLFSTDGVLLTTFTNPTPAINDLFGWSVAGIGADQVVISAVFDNTGAPDAGAAYVFYLPYPLLTISETDATISVQWIAGEIGLGLQETSSIGPLSLWTDITENVGQSGQTNIVRQEIDSGSRFYRLRRE